MAPATGHRHKRQNNQSAITSFFGADSAAQAGQNHDREASIPALPSHVQSSLLNVGMRVRKSVPEGYKNKAADDHLPSAVTTRPLPNHPRRSELQPFCGLHKTGGFLHQESGHASGADGAVRPVGVHDAFPSSAFSTQSTLASQQSHDGDNLRTLLPSAYGSSNKRALDDDEELDDDELLEEMESASAERVFAQPRGNGRLRGHAAAGIAVPDDGLDFGEADFLRAGEEMEM